MHKLILIFISLFLISCSSKDTTDLRIDQNIYDNNKLEDFELFQKSNDYIASKQFDLALIELDKIEVLFPSSIYANKGMLLKAYIYFLKEDYEKNRIISESYKKYYPGSKNIVYANYLEAMTYYVLIKKPNYSQESANEALIKLNFILNAFPDSRYEIDIITKLQILDNSLAENKLNIAKFYLRKKNINGGLIYLKDIFANHNSSLSIQETLYNLTKIYINLNEKELAKNYAAILGYNFPNSKWYEKSYNLISDKDVDYNKSNWFNKFNPIKIFINDKKKEQFEIQKID